MIKNSHPLRRANIHCLVHMSPPSDPMGLHSYILSPVNTITPYAFSISNMVVIIYTTCFNMKNFCIFPHHTVLFLHSRRWIFSCHLTSEALKGFGNFPIRGQATCIVKYADDLVLLAKEGTVLQGMTDRLIKIERCYGMEMNAEIIKVVSISRQRPKYKLRWIKNNWRIQHISTVWVGW